ncbi:glycosyltransferase family 2 protein [Rosettibacter firmus]|uniref:glycosyltransferase family 2 protein n=1 Tax=Rosettibacter firmus TaxID=3111522 RepID=UPI00336BBD17
MNFVTIRKNKVKLSSIIIARDEEQNISRCIESQLNIIDDILVLVDSRTKDNTYQIVTSYPDVRSEIVEWKGFGPTKNYAISKTKYEWVLWIDADEELSKELANDLLSFKNSTPEFNSYFIPRKSYFLGKWIKHCGWYPDYVLRLFNKNFSYISENPVHEKLIVKGESGYLQHPLIHYTYPDITHYLNKLNNYTSLAAEEIIKNNKKVTLIDILLRPAFIFIKMYILKLGFLDGLHGLILSLYSSFYVFTKYCKVWEIKKSGRNLKEE